MSAACPQPSPSPGQNRAFLGGNSNSERRSIRVGSKANGEANSEADGETARGDRDRKQSPSWADRIANWVQQEATAIEAAAKSLDEDVEKAAALLANCPGSVIVTGVGKAGLVGQKLVATLGSTGTPAHFLHPCEAVHGDLGRIHDNDVVWAISNSGRSEEILRIVDCISQRCSSWIAMTATADNPLAQAAPIAITIGKHREIDPDNLAPTASTSVMMAVGDAIAIAASQMRGFAPEDFARHHPGGSLGKKLSCAADVMRSLDRCRIARPQDSIRQAITGQSLGMNDQCPLEDASAKKDEQVADCIPMEGRLDDSVSGVANPKTISPKTISPTTTNQTTTNSIKNAERRSGAVVVVEPLQNRLLGIFTDSDLARLLVERRETALDDPICDHMTSPCLSTELNTPYESVMEVFALRKISELPVVDSQGILRGVVDLTDLSEHKSSGASPAFRQRLKVVQ